MTVLADATLHRLVMTGTLGISPMRPEDIQPASVDLHLGQPLRVQEYGTIADPEIDQEDTWRKVDLRHDGRWQIGGHRLYHGVTVERLRIPNDCLGLLSGTSTNGRLGLIVHCTAGLLDPGYIGNPTVELVHIGQGIVLRPGMVIAQVTLLQLDRDAEKPYGHESRRSRYQNDHLPTPARVRTA